MRHAIGLILLCAWTGGCTIPPRPNTPVRSLTAADPATGCEYYLYVPSNYDPERDWPLVVTLHGSEVWDSADKQMREWQGLAEREGLIVVAPVLASPRFFTISREDFQQSLTADERNVLSILKRIRAQYHIRRDAVLLTGYLEGGHALYVIGLRSANQFGMLIARDCHVDADVLRRIRITDAARAMPMVIFNGKDGWGPYSDDGWLAFRYVRRNRCFRAHRAELAGAQLRRPERAYWYWRKHRPGDFS